MAKKIKDYTCNITFYALDSTGEYEIVGHICQNKAFGDFLVSKNVVDAEEAYELYKAIFGDEDLDSFEDFEDDYTRDDLTRVVMVTKEMVDTIQKNFEKHEYDTFPTCECVTIVHKVY